MRAFLASLMLVLICWHGHSVYLHAWLCLVLFLSLFCRFLPPKCWIRIRIKKEKKCTRYSLALSLFIFSFPVCFFVWQYTCASLFVSKYFISIKRKLVGFHMFCGTMIGSSLKNNHPLIVTGNMAAVKSLFPSNTCWIGFKVLGFRF